MGVDAGRVSRLVNAQVSVTGTVAVLQLVLHTALHGHAEPQDHQLRPRRHGGGRPFLDEDSAEHAALERLVGERLASDSAELRALVLLGVSRVREALLEDAYNQAVDAGDFDDTPPGSSRPPAPGDVDAPRVTPATNCCAAACGRSATSRTMNRNRSSSCPTMAGTGHGSSGSTWSASRRDRTCPADHRGTERP
jgi:hypothetical protein